MTDDHVITVKYNDTDLQTKIFSKNMQSNMAKEE